MAFAAGGVAFGLAILRMSWKVAATVGWDVAAIVFLMWVLGSIRSMDGADTREWATREDSSRGAADMLLIAASGASLVAVALTLLEASVGRGRASGPIIAVAGACLVLSWATVNTVFMLRYASLYYAERPGGIEFAGESSPTYADFAYLAFTIGMTYQVSDTPLSTRAMRTTALRHGLISFVFVTSVVAMTINIVAQLFTA